MRPYGSAQVLEKRRQRAIQLLNQDWTYEEVSQELNASMSSVGRWRQAYRKKGRAGLKPKVHPGRTPRLSERQKKALIRTLVKGPLKAGYATDLWTLKRIGEVIQKNFRVRYGISNLWSLMGGLGWSCQKPQKRARERKKKEIRDWQKKVWPHIKKRKTT
jgi:transposase